MLRLAHASTTKDRLVDDGMDAEIAVRNLGDAEIDAERHDGQHLVLVEAVDIHQEPARLPEGVTHRQVYGRLSIDLGLGVVDQGTTVGGRARGANDLSRPGGSDRHRKYQNPARRQ